MSEQPTIAARYLTVGDVVQQAASADPSTVTAVVDAADMVAVTFDGAATPLLYDPDTRLTVAAPSTTAQDGPVTIAARHLIPGVHVAIPPLTADRGILIGRVVGVQPQPQFERVAVMLLWLADGRVDLERYETESRIALATPEQVAEAEAQGQRERLADALEDLVRDIRQQKLPPPECARRMVALLPEGLTYDRADGPAEQARATCEAGTACTGRDGRPSPYACPTCGHCAQHDHGGCAARTKDGRCGCTGEVAKPTGPTCARCALNDRPGVASRGECCSSHKSELCHRCYRETHLVEVCTAGCSDCAAEGLPIRLREAAPR